MIVERMRHGAIEALTLPNPPLDVLAQEVVAMRSTMRSSTCGQIEGVCVGAPSWVYAK